MEKERTGARDRSEPVGHGNKITQDFWQKAPCYIPLQLKPACYRKGLNGDRGLFSQGPGALSGGGGKGAVTPSEKFGGAVVGPPRRGARWGPSGAHRGAIMAPQGRHNGSPSLSPGPGTGAGGGVGPGAVLEYAPLSRLGRGWGPFPRAKRRRRRASPVKLFPIGGPIEPKLRQSSLPHRYRLPGVPPGHVAG